MEMYQIRYFLSVCEMLNFTRAAERCFVSQPSLTKAIQKLEDDLGGRLFDRTKNSVQMTEFGQTMRPYLAQLYNSVQLTKAEAKNFIAAKPARLNLGIMCTISLDAMMEVLRDFSAANPDAELRFHDGNLEQLTDALDKCEIDLAIMTAPNDFPRRFDSWPLYDEEFVIACPPQHRFTRQDVVELKELDQEPYVLRVNCEYEHHIADQLGRLGVAVKIEHKAEREDWVQTMIRAGMGIAFMPDNTCQAVGLPFCRLAQPRLQRSVQILAMANKERSRPMQAFLDRVTQCNWNAVNAGVRKRAA